MPPRRRTAATKPAPEPEVVEDEDMFEEVDEDEEADDLDLEDDVEEEPPAKPARGRKPAAKAAAVPAKKTASGFDSNWLATHVNETLDGQNLTSRDVRMLLRKLAQSGDLAREVGTDRNRYEFPKGANDPIVKKVVAQVKAGALKAAKAEGLAGAKAAGERKKAAAKTAPAKAAATTTTRRRRAPAAE